VSNADTDKRSDCMMGRCGLEKLPGSGYCFRHWIDNRIWPTLALAFASGVITGSPELPLWVALFLAVVVGGFYFSTLRSIEKLQKDVFERLREQRGGQSR